MEDPSVEEIRFGGALGIDSIALEAAGLSSRDIPLLVFVPFKIGDQPSLAEDCIRQFGTIVYEDLGADEPEPFPGRKTAIVPRLPHLEIGPVDRVDAFWKGQTRSGTYMTMNIAKNSSIEVLDILGEMRQ